MNARKLRLIAGLVLLVVAVSCTSNGPTPTQTSRPTRTPTPTRPKLTQTSLPCIPSSDTGCLAGKLVEGPLQDPALEDNRPSLAEALVVLCRKTPQDKCIVEGELRTRSDSQGTFILDSIPPGEYVVLYNPFPIPDPDAYWEQWEGGEFDYSSNYQLLALTWFMRYDGDPENFFVLFGVGPGGGLEVDETVAGNTAVWMERHPLIIEFVGNQTPASVQISPGKATQVVVKTHAYVPGGTGWKSISEDSCAWKAADRCNYKQLAGCIEEASDLDTKDDDGNTLLHRTAGSRLEDCTQDQAYLRTIILLVSMGADVNIENNQGQTPLHLVAGNVTPSGVYYLLKKGADAYVEDNRGREPAEYADENPSGDIGGELRTLMLFAGPTPGPGKYRFDPELEAEVYMEEGYLWKELGLCDDAEESLNSAIEVCKEEECGDEMEEKLAEAKQLIRECSK
jgi:hypothetical protein